MAERAKMCGFVVADGRANPRGEMRSTWLCTRIARCERPWCPMVSHTQHENDDREIKNTATAGAEGVRDA